MSEPVSLIEHRRVYIDAASCGAVYNSGTKLALVSVPVATSGGEKALEVDIPTVRQLRAVLDRVIEVHDNGGE